MWPSALIPLVFTWLSALVRASAHVCWTLLHAMGLALSCASLPCLLVLRLLGAPIAGGVLTVRVGFKGRGWAVLYHMAESLVVFYFVDRG